MRSLCLALVPTLLACATASQPATTAAVPPRSTTKKTLLVLVIKEEGPTCSPGTVCPVFNLEEVDECPNWYPALHLARLAAGCYGAKWNNRCQERLKACHACDICPILFPNEGPDTSLADSLYPEHRALTEPSGMGNFWSGWYVKFLKRSCQGKSNIEILAGDMIEEAAHACPSIGGGPIYDRRQIFVEPPPGCSGQAVQDECLGRDPK